MKKRYLLLISFLGCLAYFLFFPTPINPGSWKAPTAPSLTGSYAANTALRATQRFTHLCPQCEDVAVDSLGRIYAGTIDGRLLRFDHPEAEPMLFAETEGRPLGLIFDAQQNLIVCDADNGLFSFSPEGNKKSLTKGYKDRSFIFTNDLEIAADGQIYFTDASTRFPVATYKLDLMEHQANGAFYVYNPQTETTTLLLDQLYFANGVAISPDQQFALVAETGKFRINKYWLAGPKKGQREIIIENLPGFPDGISSGTDGVFWIAIVSPRNLMLDGLMDKPFLRNMLPRLPAILQPAPERYATVIGINGEGEVVYNLQDPEGHYSQISNVREMNGKLYFGTLGEETIAFIDRPTGR